ncbi:tyrosine-type recombinase/integrase [Succinivibrio dextrinosolvens]|uniref:Site-specific recombinase XerD n=1 Tax=Succinivibrio dextrinosolvens TaxID=83771 RepID=A0A662ZA89_9GAMM|nr:tyrosine-type recombinase/integrase [Succinivibrio dextrinosolvens]SFJ81026.1 Site-specific recombinase XerD [Succinivibrio dextrinosolvens]
MGFTNLKKRKKELLDFLKNNGYSDGRYEHVRATINWILNNNNPDWRSYDDVLVARVDAVSQSCVRDARSLVNTVYRFDVLGLMPAGNSQTALLVKPLDCFYRHIDSQYKNLVDSYKHIALAFGTPEKTIGSDVSVLSGFLNFIESRGIYCLSEVSESIILDYFLIGNKGTSYSESCQAQLKRCFKRLESSNVEIKRLLTILPSIKFKRKNKQYLSEDEMDAIKSVLDDPTSSLSYRDRSLGLLLVHTWLRRIDIVNLTFDDIDWDKETLSILTSKTDVPTRQKLSVKVLNALWDYIENERPKSDEKFIFLTHYPPHCHINPYVLNNVFNLIFDLAKIRQKDNDTRGCHLSRHYGASMALSKGVPRYIISNAVAHSSPKSLDSYLHADLVHLKGCALSIENFPIISEVYHG